MLDRYVLSYPNSLTLLVNNAFIVVDNPRLAFAKSLSEFLSRKKTPGIGKNSVFILQRKSEVCDNWQRMHNWQKCCNWR